MYRKLRKKMQYKSKQLKIKMPMFDKILAVSIPILILFFMIMMFYYTYDYQSGQKRFIQDVIESQANNQEQQLDQLIEEKTSMLALLASFPEVNTMEKDKYSNFLLAKKEICGFSDLFVVDNKGMGYYPSEGVAKDQSKEEFYNDITSHDTFATEPFYAESGPFITLSQAIENESGTRVGTLCGKVSLDTISEMVEKSETLLGGQCYMVNEQGLYLSATDEKMLNDDVTIFDSENDELDLLKNAFSTKQSLSGTIIVDSIRYYAYVDYLEEYDWAIIIMVTNASIVQTYQIISSIQLCILVLIAILVFAGVRIILAWKKSDDKINKDSLCGCASRGACRRMIEDINKTDKKILVIYCDLNNFKYVNDNYGHEMGDELLKIFSDALEEVYGSLGFVGRMGGDEFVILIDEGTVEDAELLWKKVAEILEEKSMTLSFEYNITSAHGIAKRTPDKSLKTTIEEADQNMYEDKKRYHQS